MKMETEVKYEAPEVLVLLAEVEVGFAGTELPDIPLEEDGGFE